MRSLLELAVGLLCAALIARAWLVQGFVVASGSMAPALVGIHRQVECRECRFPFVLGASPGDQLPTFGARAVCPNCDAQTPIDALPNRSGDRLLVFPAGFQLEGPRRWELALFRDPNDPLRAAIKRVVGLPGESIEIRDGNVYAEGRLLRKSLDQQRRAAVLVHDARYRPDDPRWPARWRPEDENSHWSWSEGRLRYSDVDAPAGELQWIWYRHWRRAADGQSVVEAPITDRCGYNQGVPLGAFHAVDEILLSLGFRVVRTGDLAIAMHTRGNAFLIRFDAREHLWRLFHNGKIAATSSANFAEKQPRRLEASTIDQQFLCALDGRLLFPAVPFEPRGGEPSNTKVGLAARACTLTFDNLRLYRDVYYRQAAVPRESGFVPAREAFNQIPVNINLDSRNSSPSPPSRPHAPLFRLGPDEYFVLGDNGPVSRDSRWWQSPGLPRSQLLGKPLLIGR